MSHEITACYNSPLHCSWHNKDEPGKAYKVCFECKHAYQTIEELQETWMKESFITVTSPPENLSQIDFCPLCLHDF